MGERKIVKHHWSRLALPEAHQGAGLPMSWALIGLGVLPIAIYAVSGASFSFAYVIFGANLIGVGLILATLCLILRELRRLAYEAALRAGEVRVEERLSKGFFD